MTQPKEHVRTALSSDAGSRDLVGELLANTSAASSPLNSASVLLGECMEPEHPTLTGRAKISWVGAGDDRDERWLPLVQGVVLRRGDRVLLQRPANFDEPLVTGVVDGLRQRQRYEAPDGPSLALKGDQSLTITGADGTPLCSVQEGESGPVVRLLSKDLDVEVEGRLRMTAEEVEFVARKGNVALSATDDVVIRGEMVKLN